LAKENFINNMTHELKTPLFTISIASKMLAAQEPIKQNEKFTSYIESIQEETARLTQLVDKVLETSA
jgi:two-component system phosphate regulon sensor histidine kinase PhoR